jgi:hypothetical protein
MSRVLLLGSGPLPGPAVQRLGFPQLRCLHFLRAIQGDGHQLGLVCLRGDDQQASEWPAGLAGCWEVEAERGDWISVLEGIVAGFAPDAIVSAGPYTPLRAAALVAGELPFWADIPGDPFAEAQARASREGVDEPLPAAPGMAQTRAALAALARADAFSVCSGPQLHALLGQLGVLGRLAISSPQRRWGAVIPPLYPLQAPRLQPRLSGPGEPLTVLLCGGFNTWLHEGAILEGLLSAVEGGIVARVVVTGGGIPGHHSAGWERFVAGVRASPHAGSFELHGWVPHDDLVRLCGDCDLLLSVDRPGAEAELGSRTRLLFGLHHGLELASTLRSELSRDLAAQGFLLPIGAPTGDAVLLALREHFHRARDGERVRAAQAWMDEALNLRRLTQPLCDWLHAPSRAPQGPDAPQQLAAQLADAQAELARVYGSPTWRALAGLHGALRRLSGRG